MKARLLFAPFAVALLASLSIATVHAEDLPRRTALDDYIQKPDDSYSWKVVSSEEKDGVKTVVIDMVSQHWLTKEEVNQPEWRHWLTLTIPQQVTSDVGMLFIGGGRNNEGKPRSNERTDAIAKATGTVVTELGLIPNQPLIFHNDGVERVEDDLIGYTWDQFLKTGDAKWPARNAMVKGAVRAMDTITAYMASDEGGNQTVDRFTVAGGSKRGWTTWLTGAVDDRVVAIIPIVIDVVNAYDSMNHHFAAYGFWAPAVGNYVEHKIMERMDHPRLQELYELVDPYYYRHRLTMPKLVLNAAGDQFFLPDSSQFYWDDLRGENYLRYVANGDHGLDKTDAVESIVAFHSLIAQGKKPPQYSWTINDDGSIQVMTKDKPVEVRLWQASNPEARDFRKETLGPKYTSTVIEPGQDGLYVANASTPDKGWTAYFLEMTYDVGAATPLKLTTEVKVTPDTLPFEGKPSNLPGSITVVAKAPDASAAKRIAEEAKVLVKSQDFTKDGLASHVSGKRLFLHFIPNGDARKGLEMMAGYLKKQNCEDLTYQLESGPEMTLPPILAD
ncbi:MAG: PhoPQ-activated pathogenicity-related family protein [Planctomycetaceae bacterium]|nr:PhoPQ-activated pathogenicity-related family protein [Planctomycetaceae bacterium]